MIVEDLFVLAMGGANVVLGIQWLGKLVPVTTDHKKLSIEYWRENKRYGFKAIPTWPTRKFQRLG